PYEAKHRTAKNQQNSKAGDNRDIRPSEIIYIACQGWRQRGSGKLDHHQTSLDSAESGLAEQFVADDKHENHGGAGGDSEGACNNEHGRKAWRKREAANGEALEEEEAAKHTGKKPQVQPVGDIAGQQTN